MDFQVAAPGGAAAGAAASLAARGPDPAITIPPAPHLFRRITNLALAPVPGALAPIPTTLSQSLVDSVCGPTVSTNQVPAVADRPALFVKIAPAKFEQALAQLEAEPPGVGLDPTAFYDDIAHAAAAVKTAMSRVKARGAPFHPAYLLTAADVYDLEPLNPAAAAAFIALAVAPTAFTLEHLADSEGFLDHFGFVSFLCLGNSQSATRDGPTQAARKFVIQASQLAASANLSGAIAAGGIASATAFSLWLRNTEVTCHLTFLDYTVVPDSREQNIRDRHALRYGTDDQKETLLSHLLVRQPFLSQVPNLRRIFGVGARAHEVASAVARLYRTVMSSAAARLTTLDAVLNLEAAISEPVRSLSTPGANIATLMDRVLLVDEVFKNRSKGVDGKPLPQISAYSTDLTTAMDTPAWRAVEAALIAELSAIAPRALVIVEILTNGPLLGARKVALGQHAKSEEISRLLHLSRPLAQANDFLSSPKDAGGADEVRYRAVADCLVADPVTRLPTTPEQIGFHLTFPDTYAKQILRFAVDEIDWVELLRVVSQVNNPGLTIGTYPAGLFDPVLPPLLTPLLDRVSRFLGIPLNPPAPPAPPAPPNWATLRTVVISIAAEYSSIMGVPDGFMHSNLAKLKEFEQAAWTEAARTCHRIMGFRNPAGPVISSIFEVNSAAMAKLQVLATARGVQRQDAANKPELHAMQQAISQYGSLEAMLDAHLNGRRGRSPGRVPGSPGPAATPARDRNDDRSRSKDRASKSKSPLRDRASDRASGVGSKAKDIVRHSADGQCFWYVNAQGERASVIYDYSRLESMTGKTRKELCYPVICSNKSSATLRAELCPTPKEPGHELASSSAFIPPFADFAAKAEQLFRLPAVPQRAAPSAANSP